MVTESIKSTVTDTIAHIVQVSYTYVKERMPALIFYLLEEEPFDVFQHGLLDTFLVLNIDKLTESDRFMYGFAQPLVGRDALIKPVAQFVKLQTEVNDKCRLKRVLKRQARTVRMVQAKKGDETLNPSTSLPP